MHEHLIEITIIGHKNKLIGDFVSHIDKKVEIVDAYFENSKNLIFPSIAIKEDDIYYVARLPNPDRGSSGVESTNKITATSKTQNKDSLQQDSVKTKIESQETTGLNKGEALSSANQDASKPLNVPSNHNENREHSKWHKDQCGEIWP